jgi:hypothetical protein
VKILIGILDANDETDNIVCVDNDKKTITWIPRDIYIFSFRDRIKQAFKIGGLSLFMRLVQKIGFPVTHGICIPRNMCMEALRTASIIVPIDRTLNYYYPLSPNLAIELGEKEVSFLPPKETLAGERIHQFIGARYRKNFAEYEDLPDFERIKRQQTFLKACLEQRFDFTRFLQPSLAVSHPQAIEELKKVDLSYSFVLYRKCFPCRIGSKDVLILNPSNSWIKKNAVKSLSFSLRCIRKMRKILFIFSHFSDHSR